IDALVKQLKDPDADTRRKAAKELAEAGAEAQPAGPALTAALKGKDLFVRPLAAQGLREIGPDAKPPGRGPGTMARDKPEEGSQAQSGGGRGGRPRRRGGRWPTGTRWSRWPPPSRTRTATEPSAARPPSRSGR